MLMTLTSTAPPATDLGFLLHKHPDRHQTFDLSVGTAHVFYPEADEGRCTAALLLEVDPIGLVRNRRFVGRDSFTLAQYVNDRPYAASSMLAVALGRVFGTAMAGRCDARPELVSQPLPLRVQLPALPCRGGEPVARSLFEPLGWRVEAEPVPLDPARPQWGLSRYLSVTLTGTVRLQDALRHLYVLLPVLDDAKHYWVGNDEADKLVRAGEGWLAGHPTRDLIVRRSLAHQRSMVTSAIERLADVDDSTGDELDRRADEDGADVPAALREVRLEAVLRALLDVQARSVLDAGCGEGRLLQALLSAPRITRVAGTDVSARVLARAARLLQLDRMPDRQRERIELFVSSLGYRDEHLRGFDAIVLMEVVEHLDESRLAALERNVLGDARPATVVITTPNVEYNPRFGLAPGAMRHADHRFEWARGQFRAWASAAAARNGYRAEFRSVGDEDPDLGAPTQLALLRSEASA